LRHIGTVEHLRNNNVVLLDVSCANLTSVSSNCAVGKSHIIYECKRGYKFVNNQESPTFKSICTENGWTEVPKCKTGMFNNLYSSYYTLNLNFWKINRGQDYSQLLIKKFRYVEREFI
jgi:hypothetical protein